MLKIIFLGIGVSLLLVASQARAQAAANIHARSEVDPNFIGTGEFPFINLLKSSNYWIYGDNSDSPGPDELDANGYPLYNAASLHRSLYVAVGAPSQFERPGNYVMIWTGAGDFALRESSYGRGDTKEVSCTGTYDPRGVPACDNSNCTPLTGSIAGTILTVTTASSCPLVVGQPISGAGISASQFGVPTVITAFQSGRGGAGTYTVNFVQSVPSERVNPGGKYEFSVGGEVTTSNVQWLVVLKSTATADNPSNTAQFMAFLHADDERIYWTGEIFGTRFKRLLAQANFGVIRDLNWSMDNDSNCTTWATRKPTTYWSYAASEMRKSLYAGVPIYSGNNDYAVAFGNGAPTDKETLIVRWPNTLSSTSFTINLNKTGAVQVLNSAGGTIHSINASPRAGYISTLVYDATVKGWLHFGGYAPFGSASGLRCGVPPEVFIRLNAELGTSPWITEYYLAADPITDFYTRYALYIKNNYPNMVPEFETPDEIWNRAADPTIYAYFKTVAYAAEDSAWHEEAFADDWEGKAASLLGQAIGAVYGNDRTRYKVIAGVDTNLGASRVANPRLLATSYVDQNSANIPIQPGYTQTPAYRWVTNITVHTYWGVGEGDWQQEVADAYNYFTGSPSKQAAIMARYMATAFNPYAQNTIANDILLWRSWSDWAKNCGGYGSSCSLGPLLGYEGGYGIQLATADAKTTITNVTNGNPCVLNTAVSFTGFINDGGFRVNGRPGNVLSVLSKTGSGSIELGATVAGPGVPNGTTVVGDQNARGGTGSYYLSTESYVAPESMSSATNGAVVGMKVGITKATGGAWSRVNGEAYTVQSGVTNGTIPIDLDCRDFGSLTGATLTYIGSKSYISMLRAASYAAPQQKAYTIREYDEFQRAGGSAASQFTLASVINGFAAWGAMSPDIYGNFPIATSSASTVSGTTLKLGGMVTGRFQAGQTVVGGGVARDSVIEARNSGTGFNPGDTLRLSRPSSVSVGAAINGVTIGPFPAWNGIVEWNSNHN